MVQLWDFLTKCKGYIHPLTATQSWNAGLNKAQNDKLESIQKRALAIKLGSSYLGYLSSIIKYNLFRYKIVDRNYADSLLPH